MSELEQKHPPESELAENEIKMLRGTAERIVRQLGQLIEPRETLLSRSLQRLIQIEDISALEFDSAMYDFTDSEAKEAFSRDISPAVTILGEETNHGINLTIDLYTSNNTVKESERYMGISIPATATSSKQVKGKNVSNALLSK